MTAPALPPELLELDTAIRALLRILRSHFERWIDALVRREWLRLELDDPLHPARVLTPEHRDYLHLEIDAASRAVIFHDRELTTGQPRLDRLLHEEARLRHALRICRWDCPLCEPATLRPRPARGRARRSAPAPDAQLVLQGPNEGGASWNSP